MDYKSIDASNSSQVNELVAKFSNDLDDKGKLQLPDDMPDWQKHIVRSEKRQRDAQSELGRTQTQLRESEAVNKVLSKEAMGIIPTDFEMSSEEVAALNKLKHDDPDAYRLEVNALEAKAKEFQSNKLKKLQEDAKIEVTNSYQATNRVTVLQEFRDANPDLVITDDVLVNDVPPRFMNDLNNGKIANYHDYLVEVSKYLTGGKEVKKDDNGDPHNIHGMTGGKTPGKKAAENAGKKDYSKITL